MHSLYTVSPDWVKYGKLDKKNLNHLAGIKHRNLYHTVYKRLNSIFPTVHCYWMSFGFAWKGEWLSFYSCIKTLLTVWIFKKNHLELYSRAEKVTIKQRFLLLKTHSNSRSINMNGSVFCPYSVNLDRNTFTVRLVIRKTEFQNQRIVRLHLKKACGRALKKAIKK